ncbi:MAG TPA: hypothetical protein VIL46_17390 [Gemmataceae bacterium]
MIRVAAASRLHFGLLGPPGAGTPTGVPARHYGGAGLMVEAPGVRVRAGFADRWRAEGPLAGRALEFARKVAGSLPGAESRPLEVVVEQCPPEHVGLGVGTSLGLAVARAVAVLGGRGDWGAAELARRAGRGKRSAVGVYGFEHGGFVAEAGKAPGEELSPLVGAYPFPEEWAIVLARPAAPPGPSGDVEEAAFAESGEPPDADAVRDRLCRLALAGLIPGVVARDFDGFSEALGEYNRLAGEWFRRFQRGTYASAAVASLVRWFVANGVRGTGQSSWGPTVFALLPDAGAAADTAARLRRDGSLPATVTEITRARNRGAEVSRA